MKKYLFLLILFFIPVFVYADTCNNNDIVISNITKVDSKGDVEEISSPEIVNTGISTNLRLYNVGDSITYNIKIKNNSNEEYVLNKNIGNNSNVTYEIISDNNKIKSLEEKTISLRITYSKDIDKSLFNKGKYVENKEINVILGNNIVNPNTGLNKIIVALLILVFFLLSSLVIRKDIKYLSIFIIFFMPLLVKASCQYQIKINSNIEFSVGQKCVYDGELVEGAEYVNGQYTYVYGKDLMGSLDRDGWWVHLTDNESTEPVTSKLCSSINNKPIVSMIGTFWNSQATSIDLSSFDTSNVTDMSGMFSNSQATTINLSSFDTSSVVDMGDMFSYSQATSLDLSSFDTSNAIYMSSMFSNSQATTINLSSFDTSNVIDMVSMFEASQATSLDLSSFDMSNVEEYRNMFNGSAAKTIDISSFDFVNGNLNIVFFEVPSSSYYYFNKVVNNLYVNDEDNADYFNSIWADCTRPNIYVGNTLKYPHGEGICK